MSRVFSLKGWEAEHNKLSVDHGIDFFGKGHNPWNPGSIIGLEALEVFNTLWECYNLSKPVPKKTEEKKEEEKKEESEESDDDMGFGLFD
ncbi:hypothetical protein UY3_05772 [Chelonia mydas]|uniref:Uncharacterized protein n=1 Tax=Chelonia mydas TaxID=8469 RepID=M7BYB3_CHEMY|nr:hypothetical protein UY3_05772 [Chelonia mydas]